MIVKVTKDTVKIVDEDYVLNKGEYHINTCYFQFSEEYTDDLVKKAIFVNDDTKKEMVIANNQCNIPYEVLVHDSFELRVYAYELDDNEEMVLRYSPTHTTAYLREGSYISGATAGEEITPTQFEQYQKALNDGLVEVNEKLEDVDTAITEANNLDAEVTKSEKISTLSLTKKDGTIQSVNIIDGEDGQNGIDGIDGKDAKINGVNTLNMVAGENISLRQQGSTLTISSSGGGGGGTSDYEFLSNKPSINNVELIGNKTTSDLGIEIPDVSNFITKDVDNLTNYTKSSNLSSVATSGNYNDLSNKPTIPNELADLSDDSTHRLVTDTEKTTWNNKSNFSGSYEDLTNKPTIPTVPTNLSSFTDDLGTSPIHTHSQYINAPTSVTNSSATYTIDTLTGNYSYKLGEITSLTIESATASDLETIIYFESGTTATSISIPDSITNLGDAPTFTTSSNVNTGTCNADKNYIISIINNIAIWKEY